tara:strand:- start:1301 stop:1999 length:699 start_codon:yes stop_codon:yes gene_type:complete
MDLEIKKIIDLHKIDQQIIEIHDSKGALPGIIEKQENKVEDLKSILKDSEKELKTISKSIDDFSSQTSDLSTKIEKFNNQIYSVKNNKEYEALLKEIDFLKGESANAESELSIFKAQKEEKETTITDAKTTLEDLSSKLKENLEELKVISSSTEKEEKQLSKNKDKILNDMIDKKFVESYLDGTQTFKLAVLSRDACSNCYSSLPPQFILNVKKRDKLYPCPSCGINLYWEE